MGANVCTCLLNVILESEAKIWWKKVLNNVEKAMAMQIKMWGHVGR